MILTMLILQVIAADPGALLPGVDFDLRKPPSPSRTSGNDIVVTGRRLNHRIERLPDLPADPMLPRVGKTLSDTSKLDVTVDQTTLPNGLPSNRAMVNLKIRF